MHYPLLSRFQSALLGSTIGLALSEYSQSPAINHNNQQSDWYQILNFHGSEWIDKLKQICLVASASNQPHKLAWQQGYWSVGEAALITLPVVLYYHENWRLLRQEITQIARSWQWSTEVLEDVLIWDYVVTLVLRGKFDARTIIRQLSDGVGAKQNPSWQSLKQLELCLLESQSLNRVVEKLSNQTKEWSVPLSLYCFGSSPEDFYLSIRRAAYYQTKTQMTAMLTGALAGAYNGMMGIPPTWRVISDRNALYQEIQQQGTILFKAWSGVYQKTSPFNGARVGREAIATAGTIQPRSSLTIISQQES